MIGVSGIARGGSPVRLVIAILERSDCSRSIDALEASGIGYTQLREGSGLLPFGGDRVLLVPTTHTQVDSVLDLLRGTTRVVNGDSEPRLRGRALVIPAVEGWEA